MRKSPVLPHQVVGDGHEFAVHLRGGLVDADGVVERLGHLLHAVQSLEDGSHEDDLRFLAVVALQLAAAQQVEFLVGAAELDVALKRDRIVALHHGVEHLVEADGLLFLEALVEFVALEHLRDGEVGGEANGALVAELARAIRSCSGPR